MSNFFGITEYNIEEFQDGWGWSAWNGDQCLKESDQYFPTKDEARADAVRVAGGKVHHVNPLGLPTNPASFKEGEL